MLADISQNRSQSLLKQRNMLAVFALALLVVALLLLMAMVAKDREVILAPVLSRPLTISSAGVSPEYLELVSRDAATIILNRTPSGTEYWMDAVLKIVNPSAYGHVKGQLVQMIGEQKGSDLAQAFAMTGMSIDSKALTADVTGFVTTYVGRQVISSDKKTFRFRWTYSGLSLSLIEFGQLVAVKPGDPA